MPNPEMRIYTAFDGVVSTVTWHNEREFETIKNYLKETGARVTNVHENNKLKDAVFVYVETKEQFDALIEFTNSLGQKSQA